MMASFGTVSSASSSPSSSRKALRVYLNEPAWDLSSSLRAPSFGSASSAWALASFFDDVAFALSRRAWGVESSERNRHWGVDIASGRPESSFFFLLTWGAIVPAPSRPETGKSLTLVGGVGLAFP